MAEVQCLSFVFELDACMCAFEPTCVWHLYVCVLKKTHSHIRLRTHNKPINTAKIENMFTECSNISMREHRGRLNAVSSIKYILFVVMIYGIIMCRIELLIHICLVQWWVGGLMERV